MSLNAEQQLNKRLTTISQPMAQNLKMNGADTSLTKHFRKLSEILSSIYLYSVKGRKRLDVYCFEDWS